MPSRAVFTSGEDSRVEARSMSWFMPVKQPAFIIIYNASVNTFRCALLVVQAECSVHYGYSNEHEA